MALVENDPRIAVRDAASIKNIDNNYTNFVEPSEGGNSDFNFIYDLAGYEYQTGYKIKGAGLNITNLNTNNKVYYRKSYSESVDGYRPSNSGSQLKSLDKGSGGTSVLSNCVGYVCSRLNEIWKVAVESGYIKERSNESNEYYIKHEDRKILGSIYIPKIGYGTKTVPNKRACLMWENWPTFNNESGYTDNFQGWAKSSQKNNSIKDPIDVGPVPGAIICWGDYNGNELNKNSCGHVAVVEKVLNPGQPDEAIIYSESGYDDYHIKDGKIVQIKTLPKYGVSKDYPYSLNSKRRCVGFLVSPVCQLISSVYFNSTLPFGGGVPINISKNELELRGINNSPTVWAEQKNLKIGDQVIIKSIGYKDPNDKKNPINLIKTPGIVIKVSPMTEYPYGVSINGSLTPVAFYKRNGLILK